MTTSKPKNDFDVNKIVETGSKHEEEISNLKRQVKTLEDKFGNNEKIADTLCETSEKASKMQEMLTASFLKQIKSNPEIKKALKEVIDETDRDFVRAFIKKVGWAIWTLIVALVSGAIVFFLKK